MAGSYELRIGNDCSHRGIEFSRLVLSPDGTFEQQTKFIGAVPSSDRGKWSVLGHDVSLEGVRDCTGLLSPKSPGAAMNATLLVERNGGIVILLNPDANCFYEKMKGR